ncbi:uncharacterized protein BXZ73DRAFT_90738 [Epithele typhae]|uniref:uncharacterized protein n=1 Tax=Epithele typhae TaxID=378194 RepID=UPI00200851C0|nr:uncharacterized protein BXZ73DRAFT_90738 [Epithele typhae]KAH9927468.1 hypothetical protein BXZ73DRAFT_90738 [Epithele typhae]
MEIKLTPVEDELCTLVDEFTQKLKEQRIETSCRIAGGWVRDKLLGLESNDIDLALENMMGVPFAKQLLKYCREVKGLDTNQVTEIANARTTLLGIELDLVNLRSEDYTGDSRIPTEVAFGTPYEDAMRRDITINALFYNVHSRKVEDHTGQSFGFSMVPALREAARDPMIQQAIKEKISRERVGVEVDKMMQSLHAAALLYKLVGPLGETITFPDLTFPTLPPLHPLLLSELATSSSTMRRLYLASALTPYKHLTYLVKGQSKPAVEVVIRESLRLGKQHHYHDGIPLLFSAADTLQRAVIDWEHGQLGKPERVWIGVLLRDKNVHNSSYDAIWSTSLLFALVQELTALWDAETGVFDTDAGAMRVQAYNKFVSRIEELDLPAAVDAKPVLDGNDVVRILGAKAGGQWTGAVLARVVEWQLAHPGPEGTRDAAEAWLAAEAAAGRVSAAVVQTQTKGKRGKGPAGGEDAKKAKR